MIELIKSGNLLDEKTNAIVNTVNCVGIMGKGIALQFKQAYPDNFAEYRKACEKQEVEIGKMFVHTIHDMFGDRYIINFPTKKHWKENSKYSYIEDGLKDLLEIIKKFNIKSIAIPPLGCGHGGLDWNKVYLLIEKAFSKIPDVKIKLYEPHGSPEADKIKIATEKPQMTIGRAALIGLLKEYVIPGYEITMLEIQKLMFFLQEAGEPLRLVYQKEKYGPYANNLNHVLQAIDGHYISGYGDRSNEPNIRLINGAEIEAEKFLFSQLETKERFEKVRDLIAGYETPYGLELLATVYWVNKKENMTDDESIIKSVQDWNSRKKELFKREHILKAINRLASSGWIVRHANRSAS